MNFIQRAVTYCFIASFLFSATAPSLCAQSPNDLNIKNFAQGYCGNCVVYDGNDKLILYARQSNAGLNEKGLLAGISCASGLACVGCGLASNNQYTTFGGMLFGCALLSFSAYEVSEFLKSLAQNSTKVPYITLDKEGLTLYKKRCFAWKDIDLCTRSSFTKEDGVTTKFRQLEFTAHKKKLFWINSNDIYLPLSFNEFETIIHYYINTYGGKAVPAEACKKSDPILTNSLVETPPQPPAEQAPTKYVATPLIKACRKKDISEVKRLIASGVDVNQQDSSGNTALIWAIYVQRQDIANLLIAAKAKPDIQGMQGMSALQLAAYFGYADIVKALLRAGANVNLQTDKGDSPLLIASRAGNLEIVEILLDAHADCTLVGEDNLTAYTGAANAEIAHLIESHYVPTPLADACYDGDRAKVKRLLSSGEIDVNQKDILGETALIVATKTNQPEIVKMLLDAHADPNVRDLDGNTALKRAAALEMIENVKLLLDAYADVTLVDNDGVSALQCAANDEIESLIRQYLPASDQNKKETTMFPAAHLIEMSPTIHKNPDIIMTPLIEACCTGCIKEVKRLLENKVDVNEKSSFGSSALMWAAFNGHSDIVELLLSAHANVDIQDDQGGTPLTAAAFANHLDVVKQLVKAGANVNVCSKNGKTALICAAYNGNKDIVKYLLEVNADVDLHYNDEPTALFFAAWHGYAEIVKMLLAAGADTEIREKNETTALIAAVTAGNSEIVKILLDAHADVNALDKINCTPLIFACQLGYSEVVKLLLAAHPNVDAHIKEGKTALLCACDEGHTEIVKMLLDAHANVNVQGELGETPLMIAAFKGYRDIAKLLIDAHADMNMTAQGGLTALAVAARRGNIGVLKILLAAGASCDLYCKNPDGSQELVDLEAMLPPEIAWVISQYKDKK